MNILSSAEGLLHVSEWLSIGAGVLTVAALIGIALTSRIVAKKSKREFEQLKGTVAGQQERAAKAETELLKLQQRVIRDKLPRWARLSPLGEYVKGKPSGLVEVVFVPEDGEAQKTALGIEAHLSADGGWKVLRNARPISPDDDSLLLPQYATPKKRENPFHVPFIERIGLLSDITVLTSPDDSENGFPKEGTAAHALWKGLHNCGFETLANVHPGLAAGTVRVIIGPKQ